MCKHREITLSSECGGEMMRKQKLIEVTFTLRLEFSNKFQPIHAMLMVACEVQKSNWEDRRLSFHHQLRLNNWGRNCWEVKWRRFTGHWVITSLKHVFKLRQFDVIGALKSEIISDSIIIKRDEKFQSDRRIS